MARSLLDPESRERLPELYSGEEKGLDALAQVKFFTPAHWANCLTTKTNWHIMNPI